MNKKKNEELTSADIWAMFAATDARLEKMFAENAKARKESDAKWDKMREDTDKWMKDLGERVGGISDNAGFHAEQFFQDALAKTLTFGGEKYDDMLPNLKYVGKENGEFDIVLLNGKSVAIIEAKNRIHPSDVKKLVEKKTANFRKHFPRYNDCKIYLGLAGFSFSGKVLDDAKKHGIGIIKQVGKSIEVDTDKLTAY